MNSTNTEPVNQTPGWVFGILGGLVYIAVSEILPDWSHLLAGIFAGLLWIAVYYLLPKKWNIWLRVLIPIAVVLLAAGIIRLIGG